MCIIAALQSISLGGVRCSNPVFQVAAVSVLPSLLPQAQTLGVIEAPAGLTKKHLPKHVDWRGTGADATVKDQATCGSCWVSTRTAGHSACRLLLHDTT